MNFLLLTHVTTLSAQTIKKKRYILYDRDERIENVSLIGYSTAS